LDHGEERGQCTSTIDATKDVMHNGDQIIKILKASSVLDQGTPFDPVATAPGTDTQFVSAILAD
jgi:hypothetical protein